MIPVAKGYGCCIRVGQATGACAWLLFGRVRLLVNTMTEHAHEVLSRMVPSGVTSLGMA